jgi:hypothetical protein
LFWRFPKITQSRYTDSNALKRSPSAMRLGWRAATGVETVQSECGILATATPAPLRKNSGEYILERHRALLQFERTPINCMVVDRAGAAAHITIEPSGATAFH